MNDENSIEKRRGGNPTQNPCFASSTRLSIMNRTRDQPLIPFVHNAEVLAPHPGTAIIVDDNTFLA